MKYLFFPETFLKTLSFALHHLLYIKFQSPWELIYSVTVCKILLRSVQTLIDLCDIVRK